MYFYFLDSTAFAIQKNIRHDGGKKQDQRHCKNKEFTLSFLGV